MRKNLLLSLALLCLTACVEAPVDLANCRIVTTQQAPQLVKHIATVLADDIAMVCGNRPQVVELDSGQTTQPGDVLIATLPSDQRLLQADTALFADIRGRWEAFAIRQRDNRLLLVGSDPRGAAYAALHVSKTIGVDPWHWWADLPVKHADKIPFDYDFLAPQPDVKYRGLFINDEDWGLYTWASRNFEKDLNDIGPRTYDKVCELILRLGGNMLAPAMHSCTGAFFSHPESQRMADKWGIMITTSHCEPMLFNNAAHSEWNRDRDGEWNWQTNQATIVGKFEQRLADTQQFDNIYTMGMRGLHDEGMRGPTDPAQRARVLEEVFSAQRDILARHKKRPANQIPQIFVPYKETLDTYDAGLNVPDDITIVWPDDNYGYMKRVSNDTERQRSGRAGVYYHLSYLGTPHDYLWICTTPPALMACELRKAYDAGADRYWLLNVGDIKPMELAITHFFELARDIRHVTPTSANQRQARILAHWFGQQHTDAFQRLLDDYYQLAWPRKPEFMGGEIEWDTPENSRTHDSEWSAADGSLQRRLQQAASIAQRADSLQQLLPPDLRDAWFEMVNFPCHAQCWMNHKWLYAQLNHETGSQQDAQRATNANDSIQALMARYNSLRNGKWNGMMSQVPPGFCALYQQMPPLTNQPTTHFALPDEQRSKRLANKLDLRNASIDTNAAIETGLGIDWHVLRLGQPLACDTKPTAHLALPDTQLDADSIQLCLSIVPFWPSNPSEPNTLEVTLDAGPAVILQNHVQEWSAPWKAQVLANRKEYLLTLPLDGATTHHTLHLTALDPGLMIQEITWQATPR